MLNWNNKTVRGKYPPSRFFAFSNSLSRYMIEASKIVSISISVFLASIFHNIHLWLYSIVFILIKLPNFFSDIHFRPQNNQRLFSKAGANCGFEFINQEFIQNPVFYFSIYFSTGQRFIAFMAFFSSLFSRWSLNRLTCAHSDVLLFPIFRFQHFYRFHYF
jgi:hypothetical protein